MGVSYLVYHVNSPFLPLPVSSVYTGVLSSLKCVASLAGGCGGADMTMWAPFLKTRSMYNYVTA